MSFSRLADRGKFFYLPFFGEEASLNAYSLLIQTLSSGNANAITLPEIASGLAAVFLFPVRHASSS